MVPNTTRAQRSIWPLVTTGSGFPFRGHSASSSSRTKAPAALSGEAETELDAGPALPSRAASSSSKHAGRTSVSTTNAAGRNSPPRSATSRSTSPSSGPSPAPDLNDAGTLQEVRDFMLLVQDVRQLAERQVTFIVVHHESKGGKVSGAWEGAGDTLLHVQAQGHGRTRLYIRKARRAFGYHATALNLTWPKPRSALRRVRRPGTTGSSCTPGRRRAPVDAAAARPSTTRSLSSSRRARTSCSSPGSRGTSGAT
jgi:hypothetical protein